MSIETQSFVLAGGDVHLWQANVCASYCRTDYKSLLNAGELTKASQFRYEDDRGRYITLHGLLRVLLGKYLNCDPGSLILTAGSGGKPMLEDGSINFNLSHSADIALYAFSANRWVGVDVEKTRDHIAYQRIAERFFTFAERKVLAAIPSSERRSRFFDLWAQKEALYKGCGQLKMKGEYTIKTLSPAPGYVAAIAVQGNGCRFTYQNWSDFDSYRWVG